MVHPIQKRHPLVIYLHERTEEAALFKKHCRSFNFFSAMRSFPLKFSIQPALGYGVDEISIQPICQRWNFSPTVLYAIVGSSQRLHLSRPLRARAYTRETLELLESLGCFQSKDIVNSTIDQTDVAQLNGISGETSSAKIDNENEKERRRKIGLANKGKVPWNKGRKHSAETRERIRQRTIEALRDPKIQQKMAEHARPHSDEIKAKISFSIRQHWGRRLKAKRSKQKFFSLWGDSIAEAAKSGWTDQEQLEWDSYDVLKRKLEIEKLRRVSEKERAKIFAKERLKKAAQARAEKIARLEHKRNEREVKRKQKEEEKAVLEETAETKEDSAVTLLKQRLEKIHRKKPGTVQISSNQGETMLPNIEKVDLERIRKEKARKELSLAEQIQAAKSMRAESQ